MDTKHTQTIFVRTMYIMVILALVFSISNTAYAAQGTAPHDSSPLIWRDDFDGTMRSEWVWINENSGEWSLEANPGFLTIWTSPVPTGRQNLLLRPAPVGDFTIQTRLLFQPSTNFEFAGLVVWQDEGNFLQLGCAFCAPEFSQCVGNGIYFDFVQPGPWGDNFATQVENPGEAYLRLIRQGLSLKAYYSGNNFDWVLIGEHILPAGFKINSVGLTSSQHYDTESNPIPADFDYFVLNRAPFPFIGQWQAIDVDGGDIRLSIGGKPSGPFRITWTESYFGFCGGKAGIARGIGWLNPEVPYLLEANLHLTCFTTGDQVDFHLVWRYDPSMGWLASRDDGFGGFVTTWHRPGESLPLLWNLMIAHPDENWVEGMGFPEGTVVSLLIRDTNGVNLFMGTTVASYPEWDPYNTAARFFLDFDLKAGDHLWMSDGMVAKDLIVTNLQITDTNFANKTVSGIATPGGEVVIEYFPEGAEPVMFSVFADQDGFWTAYVEDLVINLPGLASEPDEDGDLTRVAFIVPKMDLRVNYGHDWVESFYEAGHTVSIQVTDSEGNVKATAEVLTTPRNEWGGAEGFQTRPEDWAPAQPDTQPDDWVYAQVDNGATAQVRIGEISGMIDLESDSIGGAISAPWFYDEENPIDVNVECHPWGSPEPVEMKFDTILPNGIDTYSCAWNPETEWDIQPGQDIGVGYFGLDGHWVANVISNPQTWAFPEANQVFGYGWPVGSEVNLTINGEYIAIATVQGAPWNANDIMAFFDFSGVHDLIAGDVVALSGSGMERTHTVQNLAVTAINIEPDTVSGTADTGATVHAWVHEFGHEVWVPVVDGVWSAYFGSDEFHLEPGMCGRAEIRVEGNNSTNVDWCVP
jgi:hypothetical protein